jgi:copper transport protein
MAAVAAAALGAGLARASPAAAHALARSSNPPAGAALAEAPTTVTIVFSEPPDPRLSSIQILDSAGNPHQMGRAVEVPGHPDVLQVGVGQLGPGVYTVAWRTVSRVDGHLASGSFEFGVKVTPAGAAAATAVVRSPPASTWAVGARWLFYVGTMGLLGAAEIGLLGGPGRRLRWIAAFAWVVAAAGVVALEEQQRRADGIALGGLWGSSLGHEVTARGLPLAATGLAVGWLWMRPRSRWALAAVGVGALATMFGDVDASHAAGESSWRWFRMATQWAHFASAGLWLGGLIVLVLKVVAMEAAERPVVTRRFSRVAVLAVVLVATTGLLRGLDEIRSWHGLFATSFGRWALLKIGLLVVLVGLGYLNRRRGLASAVRGPGRTLRNIGAGELMFAAVILLATGFLQSLAPPSATAQPHSPPPLLAAGNDFATTVRVRLAISPGEPGFNRFTARVVDYDTLQPIVAGAVSLTFVLPSRPGIGESNLVLARQSNGVYEAEAPNLSVAGTWTITVLIQRGAQSAEVPLTVTTRTAPVRIDVSRSPGLPTVYTIHASATASLQVYLDPGRPGFNEFHVTVLAPNGNEVPTSRMTVHASGLAHPVAIPLTVRKLDSIGHYVADLPAATAGNYHFSIDATTDQGPLHADITIPVA